MNVDETLEAPVNHRVATVDTAFSAPQDPATAASHTSSTALAGASALAAALLAACGGEGRA
jgi:hypothetical protein